MGHAGHFLDNFDAFWRTAIYDICNSGRIGRLLQVRITLSPQKSIRKFSKRLECVPSAVGRRTDWSTNAFSNITTLSAALTIPEST
jgi:hypothetical protein